MAASTRMTPGQRSLRSSIASNIRWSRTSSEKRTEETEAGRRAFNAKFEQEVDPEGKLPPDERAKLAANARRAHFQRMAAKSAKVRARRKAAAE